MSFWSDISTYAAPIAGIVISVFQPELAPEIGSALLGSEAGTVAATAAGQAVIGAGLGAAQAAATGQDVVKGATKGGEAGAVSGAISSGFQDSGIISDAPTSQAVGKGLGTAGGAFATGTKPQTAIEEGLISGGVDYLVGSPGPGASTTDQLISGLEKAGITTALDKYILPSTGTGSASVSAGPTTSRSTLTTATPQAGTTPGSSALAQALNVGDIGAPIFGSSNLGKSKKVWNKESLRNPNQGA